MTQYTEPVLNRTVLMSGPRYFGVKELNPFEDKNHQPDLDLALREFLAIIKALEQAGINVIKVDEPEDCQDGIFTANWGLCRGETCILSSLPKQRKDEEPYAKKILQGLGKKVIKPPFRFSGQGDALPCGDLLFAGMGFRNDPQIHQFIADTLGYKVIGVHAVPLYDKKGEPAINKVTGLPDSYFYDIDLAISILRKDLIAWCPEALMPESQEVMRGLRDIEKIVVSLEEALNFGCNLVSTGTTVIMGAKTPQLQAAIESHGLHVVTVEINELSKAGGFIRCTTLTLDNE